MHLVFDLPIRRRVIPSGPVARRLAGTLVALLAVCAMAAPRDDDSSQQSDVPGARDILDRVWLGVENAGRLLHNGCGRITETRVSPLLVKPLVLKGTFCASGTTAFRLDYTEPEPLRVIYNQGILNVTTAGGHRTEVWDIRSAVDRTQRYFSGAGALENLRRDFSVAATEEPDGYSLTLVPVSGRLARRVRQVVVKFRRDDYVLRALEIRGKSGVDSTFDVSLDRRNIVLEPDLFRVYRPREEKESSSQDGH